MNNYGRFPKFPLESIMGSPNKFGLEFRVQGLCVCAGGNGRRGELPYDRY